MLRGLLQIAQAFGLGGDDNLGSDDGLELGSDKYSSKRLNSEVDFAAFARIERCVTYLGLSIYEYVSSTALRLPVTWLHASERVGLLRVNLSQSQEKYAGGEPWFRYLASHQVYRLSFVCTIYGVRCLDSPIYVHLI